MGDLSVIFYFLKEKIMFYKSLNKIKPQSPKENPPDYSATVLVAKLCANSHKHSVYIIFLWQNPGPVL